MRGKHKEKDENNILTGGFVQMRTQHEKPVVVNEKDKKVNRNDQIIFYLGGFVQITYTWKKLIWRQMT